MADRPPLKRNSVHREVVREVGEAGAEMKRFEYPILGAGAGVKLRVECDAPAEPVVDVTRQGQFVENVVRGACPHGRLEGEVGDPLPGSREPAS